MNQSSAVVDVFYNDCHGAIIMFDTSAPDSYTNLSLWYNELREKCGSIPIVVAGNKVDIKDRKVRPSFISFPREHSLKYCELSGMGNYNFQQPFLCLARELVRTNNLQFISHPVLCEPEVEMDPLLILEYEKELKNTGSDQMRSTG